MVNMHGIAYRKSSIFYKNKIVSNLRQCHPKAIDIVASIKAETIDTYIDTVEAVHIGEGCIRID